MSFDFSNLIPDSVKERFLEDESAPPQVPAKPSPVVVVPTSNFHPPITSNVVIQGQQSTSSALSGILGGTYTTPSATLAILTDLRSKTDFDATPIGQQLKSNMDALDGTGLADDIKSKTAMKLSHQSPAQVVSVLQGLQSILVSDRRNFDATMQTATAAEVDARQAKSG